MEVQQIAIDGTAGSGKSTLGDHLAKKSGYLYVDTGAMYRAVTWLALARDVDIYDEADLAVLAKHADIEICQPHVHDGRQYTVFIDHQDITWSIREARVARAVAIVSSHIAVRTILIKHQQKLAQQKRVVMVGRDIGTVVLPDADLKIFLDADPEIRACRRYNELLKHQGKEISSTGIVEDVLNDLLQRDEKDRANMRIAPDALHIMTDNLDALELVEIICKYIQTLSESQHTASVVSGVLKR